MTEPQDKDDSDLDSLMVEFLGIVGLMVLALTIGMVLTILLT